jgi:hypothetical protein
VWLSATLFLVKSDLVKSRESATTTRDIDATPLCPYNNILKAAVSRDLALQRQDDVKKIK